MRVGKVIGRVVLTQTYETLVGGRFLLVEVQDRFSLSGRERKSGESLVVYDHLGAHVDGVVVASDLEGYRHVARADCEALLVPPGDVNALRSALRRLLDDVDLRAKLSAAGGARAEEFSMTRLAERLLPVYDRAIVVATASL